MPDGATGLAGRARPRVLVTGFSVFPGAPVNPTEWLAGALRERAGALSGRAELFTDVLAVDYRALPLRLEMIGREIDPDIAIHFGLSAAATGFTLERLAHNRVNADRPDNERYLHPAAFVHEEGGSLDSTLPLGPIHSRLTRLGLPVAYSASAGDYLCNYLFYLAHSPHFAAYAPAMAGFIHVPPFPSRTAGQGLSPDDLLQGAMAIVETCCDAWAGMS